MNKIYTVIQKNVKYKVTKKNLNINTIIENCDTQQINRIYVKTLLGVKFKMFTIYISNCIRNTQLINGIETNVY